MKNLAIAAIVLVGFASCKNSKKAEKAAESSAQEAKTEAVAEESDDEGEPFVIDESEYQPVIVDSLFFKIERTPCFGQCPVYSMSIYQSGRAELEGRKFFDFIGTYTVKFTESEMIQIKQWADQSGFWKMNTVFDAPVTDLPSTTTILVTDYGTKWVYNRMNAPDALREFETNVETLIKDKQWMVSNGKKTIEE